MFENNGLGNIGNLGPQGPDWARCGEPRWEKLYGYGWKQLWVDLRNLILRAYARKMRFRWKKENMDII